jgi:4-amino-4-deoxy-L-arabinose transferase-like glycosyltransferase
LTIVAAAELWRARHRQRPRWVPLAIALVLFVVPVTAWLVARWRLDQWRFISKIFTYDFVARALTVIEDHPGTPLYYLNILQRNQFDWVAAGVVAWLVCALPWRRVVAALSFWRANDASTMLMAAWAVIAFLIPTIMRTKLSWYLNPFYPPFALGVAWLFVHGVSASRQEPVRRQHAVLVLVFIVALGAAESRLVWYSFHRRALTNSTQGLLLAERNSLRGQKVFRHHWTHSEIFVLKGLVGAEHRETASLAGFLLDSNVGDYLFSSADVTQPNMLLVRTDGRHYLFRRRE